MRKFLIVVDNTPECLKALRFAARRAQRTKGGVSLLYLIEPEDFQHWMVIQDASRAEAVAEAEARLQALSEEVKALAGITPEVAVREGRRRDQLLEHIAADPEIRLLVLGAGVEGDGPGPLVKALVGQMGGRLPIPVTIVPGALSLEEIDDLC
ncbi:MAG: universal stress protein [Pseudomonadota bacterium]